MNTNSPQQPFVSQFRDDAREAVQTAAATAKDAAGHATQTARDGLNAATDTAKDAYQTARSKAEETYQNVRSKADETYRTVRAKADETAAATGEYVRQHPGPSVLGAVALGVGLGYLLALSARRPPPSFREQYVDEPLDAARDALYAVLAPVARRLHGSYDSARDHADKAMDKAHHFDTAQAAHSLADQLRRVGGNLKFW